MIEIWMGTPNEMALATTPKRGQAEAVKWVRGHLEDFKKHARTFSNAEVEGIQSVADDLGKATTITKGDKRTWEFTYMGTTVRIELRKK